MVWRQITGGVGIAMILGSNKFWWEVMGIGIILVVCLLPNMKRKGFRRVN